MDSSSRGETPVIADRRDFRLAKTVRPRRYDLRFDLDLDQWRSTGTGQVELHLDEPSREIVLHSLELDIRSARISAGPALEAVSYDEEAQIATLRFDGEIPAGDHVLE